MTKPFHGTRPARAQCFAVRRRRSGHTYIGSEHILLGLMADDASIAAKMLRAHGADRTRVREAVVNMAGEGVPSQSPPPT